MFTCVYIFHRLNPLLGTKLGFFVARSLFLLAGSSSWPKLSGTTTLLLQCSVTEENELDGNVTAPCPSKRHSVAAQRIGLKSTDVTRLVTTEHIQNKYSLLKSRCNNSCNSYCKLVDNVSLDLNCCTSQLKR